MTWDYPLFLALNFDGGPAMDRAMLALSGTAMWLPLYALIVWLVSRRYGWRGAAIFLAVMLAALVLSDAVAGIFKHNGLLGDLLPGLEPRWRPMFTPELEGLAIAPDSLYALRQAGAPGPWRVHVPVEAVAGYYGTVSAHAATVVALAVLSCAALRRRWFTCLMVAATLAVCYSRIYLAKHFPMDLLWGAALGGALGWAAWRLFGRLTRGSEKV
ncbi:phosphatase PAP2 family protein [uncultured Alistipes sp.]|uniref:phosphatase PAP2 family protein n=1 Tax=uncultured Alistipes sp. TaxID=538949 RepID=UPI0026393DDF|nr:phosphatase PAP2 family protein [uncultured Alistipes sp.]